MPSISHDARLQTVITTFEMTPGTCHDLLDLLRAAYAEFISRQPGFLGAALHVNDAQTRIANYSPSPAPRRRPEPGRGRRARPSSRSRRGRRPGRGR